MSESVKTTAQPEDNPWLSLENQNKDARVKGFKVFARNESLEKNSERFEQFDAQVKAIRINTEQAKRSYGAGEARMSSFSPDLLPTSERSMLLSREVFEDYRRILSQTNSDGKEHNFLWLGKKQSVDKQEHYSIEKAIPVPELPDGLSESTISPSPKINIYDNISQYGDYDVIVDGHTHPVQAPDYMDFDKLPQSLINELSLRRPGENFSISDLSHYVSLLSVGVGKNIKDKTVIGAVITYTGELLNIVSDKDDDVEMPTTIRHIEATSQNKTMLIPTNSFAKEKSEQFFGKQKQ